MDLMGDAVSQTALKLATVQMCMKLWVYRAGEERGGVSGTATGDMASVLVGGTANNIPLWLRANVAFDTWESVAYIGYTYAKVDDCI